MAFNGGRSQLNFNLAQTGNEFPFINCLKTAQQWTTVSGGLGIDPSILDANGYPTSIVSGGVETVFYIPTPTERPGNYKIQWSGTGTVCGYSGTNGDITYTPTDPDGRIVFNITAGTNVTNCRFIHVDDEAAYNAGQVFGTRFLAKLREANFGVLRFLNWQDANISNVRYWADRKPTGYAFYYGYEQRASLYGGVTTNIANAYSVTAPSGWGGLVDKAIVTCKFNATATSDTPTLNVGGTGAKTIKREDTDALGIYGAGDRPTSGRYGTLIYDADLDCWIKHGGDTFTYDVYLKNGIPIELCLQLCTEVGAHPWFVTPYLACDPSTDWNTGLATYLRDNAPSWMIPRIEVVPNECWNSAGGFYGTRYGWAKATDRWGVLAPVNDTDNWVGRAASLQGAAISAVYANDRTRYQAIIGVHTNLDRTQQSPRLASTLHVSEDGGSAAYNWVTHVCVAGYYTPVFDAATQQTMATDYAAADAAGKLVIATAFANDGYNSLTDLNALYIAWKAWAAGYGVLGLTQYEGGWSPDYTGDTNLDALREASKAVTAMSALTTTNYTYFTSAGGQFPSCFQLGGADNIWAVFDPSIYSTPSPQWTAICNWNSPKRSGLRFRLHS